jgi:hypothetical protein
MYDLFCALNWGNGMAVGNRAFPSGECQWWLQAGSPTSKLGATYSDPASRKLEVCRNAGQIPLFVIQQWGQDFSLSIKLRPYITSIGMLS